MSLPKGTMFTAGIMKDLEEAERHPMTPEPVRDVLKRARATILGLCEDFADRPSVVTAPPPPVGGLSMSELEELDRAQEPGFYPQRKCLVFYIPINMDDKTIVARLIRQAKVVAR